MEKRALIIISASVLFGMIAGALILGRALMKFRSDDRYISVKGFSEREVKSDFAVWTITTRVASNDMAEGSRAVEESKNKVIGFLERNNIRPEEIIQKGITVNDKKAQEYGGYNIGDSYRFIIDKIIQVRSSDVDNILRVSRMTDELLRAGVVISSSNPYEGSVRFVFTKLNEIKPDMLTEAILNARRAADQFTKESGTKLGKLRKASQGYFTIIDRDADLSGQQEGYYPGNGSDVFKKIRVVVSTDYAIN